MKPQKITQNTGASVGATGSLSLVIVWLAGNLFHLAVSAEDGVVMATIISAVALFVAHYGIVGIWDMIVRGTRRNQVVAPDAPQP
jgi:hypothetical protein